MAAGYDTDKAKARGFVESEMPVVEPVDPRAGQDYDALICCLVESADAVVELLTKCVRRSLFHKDAKVEMNAATLATVRERFWDNTRNEFFAMVELAATGADPDVLRLDWLRILSRTARTLFQETTPLDAFGDGHPRRIVQAARKLGVALAGYEKDGAALYAVLGLPAREAGVMRKRGKREATS